MRPIQLVSTLVAAILLGNAQGWCAGEAPLANSSDAQAGPSQQRAEPSETATSGSQSVRLQILVVELPRATLRASGITIDKPSAKKAAAASSAADRLFTSSEEAEGAGCTVVDENSPLLKTLEGLLAKGQAKVLSRPTLETVIGRPTWFSLGGEFPVPTTSQGNPTIEFTKYGARIDMVALLVDKAICLDLRVRLSELDSANGITVDGLTIPALQVLCDMDTRTRLKHGQVLLSWGSSRSVRKTDSPEKGHHQTPGAQATETYEEEVTLIAVRPQLTE